jgi:hypothetical protein
VGVGGWWLVWKDAGRIFFRGGGGGERGKVAHTEYFCVYTISPPVFTDFFLRVYGIIFQHIRNYFSVVTELFLRRYGIILRVY